MAWKILFEFRDPKTHSHLQNTSPLEAQLKMLWSVRKESIFLKIFELPKQFSKCFQNKFPFQIFRALTIGVKWRKFYRVWTSLEKKFLGNLAKWRYSLFSCSYIQSKIFPWNQLFNWKNWTSNSSSMVSWSTRIPWTIHMMDFRRHITIKLFTHSSVDIEKVSSSKIFESWK